MVEIDTMTFAGFRTRVVTQPGAGPPVVLLHGMYDTAETWRAVVRELANRGRRAVAVDLPGYGWTDRRRPGPVLPQLDAFVDDLLRSQGPGAVLVGNSLGATLAVRAAARSELGISRAVAIAVPGYGFRPGIGWGVGRRSPLPVIVRRAPLPKQVLSGARSRTVLARVLRTSQDSEDFRIAVRFGQMLSDREILLGLIREAQSVLGEIDGPTGPLPAAPVLFVHGSRDPLIPVAAARRAHRLTPGSSLHVIGGGGHLPQREHAALVTDLIEGDR